MQMSNFRKLHLKEPGSLPALSLYTTGKEVLVRGSETVISVLGMTSIVSSLSHWFGVVFQVLETIIFLIGNRLPPSQIILKTEDDEEKSVASVSAVLFFVLALQTGLTGMEGEKRFQQVLTSRDVVYFSSSQFSRSARTCACCSLLCYTSSTPWCNLS